MKHSSKFFVAVLVVFVALTMTVGSAFAAKKRTYSYNEANHAVQQDLLHFLDKLQEAT